MHIKDMEAFIAPSLAQMGHRLVALNLLSHGRHPVLQVLVERHNGDSVSIDDCVSISRQLSALLDVEDALSSRYTLEVGSPGLHRPLLTLDDYQRFVGRMARVETHVPLDSRRRFVGQIERVDGDSVVLLTDEGSVMLPFSNILKGKLHIQDSDVKQWLKQSEDKT